MNALVGDRAEHLPIFGRACEARAGPALGSRGFLLRPFLKQVVKNLGQLACPGVHARNVGRQQQNALWLGGDSFPVLQRRLAALIRAADPKKFPQNVR